MFFVQFAHYIVTLFKLFTIYPVKSYTDNIVCNLLMHNLFCILVIPVLHSTLDANSYLLLYLHCHHYLLNV